MGAIAQVNPVGTEITQVYQWRLDELMKAGYPTHLAVELAHAPNVDLHQAIDLIDSGCPPYTAAEILL